MSAVGVRRDTTESLSGEMRQKRRAERLEVWDGLDEPMLSEPRVECGIWKLKVLPWPTSSKDVGSLQANGIELCQQPEYAWKWTSYITSR